MFQIVLHGIQKQKFRFTLQFDKNDTEHQKVVEILNEKGKKKSQYIVQAILSYSNNKNTMLSKEDLNYIIKEVSENIKDCSIINTKQDDESENILADSLKLFEI